MQRMVATITPTGTAGASEGNATLTPGYNGKLYAVYLDYAANVTSVTNVTLALTSPVLTVFTVSDNATDGWFWPRETAVTQSNTAYASTAGLMAFPVVGHLRLSTSSSSPRTNAVTAYVYIEEQ